MEGGNVTGVGLERVDTDGYGKVITSDNGDTNTHENGGCVALNDAEEVEASNDTGAFEASSDAEEVEGLNDAEEVEASNDVEELEAPNDAGDASAVNDMGDIPEQNYEEDGDDIALQFAGGDSTAVACEDVVSGCVSRASSLCYEAERQECFGEEEEEVHYYDNEDEAADNPSDSNVDNNDLKQSSPAEAVVENASDTPNHIITDLTTDSTGELAIDFSAQKQTSEAQAVCIPQQSVADVLLSLVAHENDSDEEEGEISEEEVPFERVDTSVREGFVLEILNLPANFDIQEAARALRTLDPLNARPSTQLFTRTHTHTHARRVLLHFDTCAKAARAKAELDGKTVGNRKLQVIFSEEEPPGIAPANPQRLVPPPPTSISTGHVLSGDGPLLRSGAIPMMRLINQPPPPPPPVGGSIPLCSNKVVLRARNDVNPPPPPPTHVIRSIGGSINGNDPSGKAILTPRSEGTGGRRREPVSAWHEDMSVDDQIADYRHLLSKFGYANRYLVLYDLPPALQTLSALQEWHKSHTGENEVEIEMLTAKRSTFVSPVIPPVAEAAAPVKIDTVKDLQPPLDDEGEPKEAEATQSGDQGPPESDIPAPENEVPCASVSVVGNDETAEKTNEQSAADPAASESQAVAAEGKDVSDDSATCVIAHITYRTKKACVNVQRKLQGNAENVKMEQTGPRKANSVLWIGNVRDFMTRHLESSTIRSLFENFGELLRLKFVCEKNCGFAHYSHTSDAIAARNALHGIVVGDVSLNIDFSPSDPWQVFDMSDRPRSPSPSRMHISKHMQHHKPRVLHQQPRVLQPQPRVLQAQSGLLQTQPRVLQHAGLLLQHPAGVSPYARSHVPHPPGSSHFVSPISTVDGLGNPSSNLVFLDPSVPPPPLIPQRRLVPRASPCHQSPMGPHGNVSSPLFAPPPVSNVFRGRVLSLLGMPGGDDGNGTGVPRGDSRLPHTLSHSHETNAYTTDWSAGPQATEHKTEGARLRARSKFKGPISQFTGQLDGSLPQDAEDLLSLMRQRLKDSAGAGSTDSITARLEAASQASGGASAADGITSTNASAKDPLLELLRCEPKLLDVMILDIARERLQKQLGQNSTQAQMPDNDKRKTGGGRFDDKKEGGVRDRSRSRGSRGRAQRGRGRETGGREDLNRRAKRSFSRSISPEVNADRRSPRRGQGFGGRNSIEKPQCDFPRGSSRRVALSGRFSPPSERLRDVKRRRVEEVDGLHKQSAHAHSRNRASSPVPDSPHGPSAQRGGVYLGTSGSGGPLADRKRLPIGGEVVDVVNPKRPRETILLVCQVLKQGQPMCNMSAKFIDGDSSIRPPASLDVNQRANLERLQSHLRRGRSAVHPRLGGSAVSGSTNAGPCRFSIWQLGADTRNDSRQYDELCDYFINKERVGLLESRSIAIYMVPPNPKYIKPLNLPDANFMYAYVIAK